MAPNRRERNELSCFCKDLMTLEPEAKKWCATLCGHMYHYDCLLTWCADHENCPQCRKIVRVRDIVQLYPTESDDPPEEDLSEILQANLEEIQAKLSEKDDLCKKKDEIIKDLKVDADSYNNFRLENEALKSVLEIFDGKTLEMMLDDPEEFDEIIASKLS